jgi:predicted RNA-binding protein YlxR (DUF448 family)
VRPAAGHRGGGIRYDGSAARIRADHDPQQLALRGPLPATDARPDRSRGCGGVRAGVCVGCRERAAKNELLRVVAGSDANGPAVVPDPTGTAPGRGAHLHPTVACYDLAVRRRAFARALRLAQGLPSTAVREHLAAPPQ